MRSISAAELVTLVQQARNRITLVGLLLNAAEIDSFAELGVWRGAFAKRILAAVPSLKRYTMVDPWRNLKDWNKPFNVDNEEFEEIFREAMFAVEPYRDKITVLRGTTKEVIDDIPDESIDAVYIDGDHTLRGIALDLALVLPKVKDGGYIICDDFNANPWKHGFEYEPTLVFPYAVYFAEARNFQIYGLPYRQAMIRKTEVSDWSFTDLCGDYSRVEVRSSA